jgi:hypothetical protein
MTLKPWDIEASHPVWALARLTAYLLALVAILYANASHFDVTELRTIIGMFLFGASAEGATRFFAKKREQSVKENENRIDQLERLVRAIGGNPEDSAKFK